MTQDSQAVPDADASPGRSVNLVDVLVVAGFAAIAAVYHLGSWKGATPYPIFSGDASNLASFAAALDYPELLAGDPVLGDPENFRFYMTVHIPFLRFFENFTGDYGSAFIALLGPHVFLMALGFYLLGRTLFQNRFWAMLLALINLVPLGVGIGTFWGIHHAPLARFSYQALLPFLLTATVLLRDSPRRWPWLMVAAGLLMYVHPVSAPSWAFALWLGLWALLPGGWSAARRIGTMFALGCVFLAVAAPFLVNYLGSHEMGAAAAVEYDELYALMETIYHPIFLDTKLGIRHYYVQWLNAKGWLWVWGAIGAGVVFWLRREDRRLLATIGLWLVGIATVTLALPLVEQAVARSYEVLPIEIDLARGSRYFVPLMLLFCIWPLAEIQRRTAALRVAPLVRLGLAGVGFLLLATWSQPQAAWKWRQARMLHASQPFGSAIDCFRQGRLTCTPFYWLYTIEATEAVRRETPPGSKILPTDLGLQIRYMSRRPVVFEPKDRAVFGYSNYPKLLDWMESDRRMKEAAEHERPEARFEALVSLARDLDARYLLVRSDFTGGASLTEVGASLDYPAIWSNRSFALFPTERDTPSPTDGS